MTDTDDGGRDGPQDRSDDIGGSLDGENGGIDGRSSDLGSGDDGLAPDAPVTCISSRQRLGWAILADGLRIGVPGDAEGVRHPSFALSLGDHPILAWKENSRSQAVQFAEDLCLFEKMGSSQAGYQPMVALAAGVGGQVYLGTLDGGNKLIISRWNGQDWEPFGPSIAVVGNVDQTEDIEMQVDGDGLPIAVWVDRSRIRVARWTPTEIQQLTDEFGVLEATVWPGMLRPLSLAVGADGTLAVGYRGSSGEALVARYVGGQWSAVGAELPEAGPDFSEYLHGPVVQVGQKGDLFVAWNGRLARGSRYRSFAARWDGSKWITLGSSLASPDSFSTTDFWMALDAQSNPIVVAEEFINGAGSRLFFYKWDGTAWQTPLQPLDAVDMTFDTIWPRVAVDSHGRWLVSWFQYPTSNSLPAVFLARYTP